jgi:hypothetical protein
MSSALRLPQPRLDVRTVVLWPVLIVGAAFVTAGLLLWSIQAAAAATCVFGLTALYVSDRSLGATSMVIFWFIAPFIRRLIQYRTGFVNADPLSVAPFVATAAMAAAELGRTRLSAPATRTLASVAAGFLIGVPVGLAAAPVAAVFAIFGYLAGLSAAVIGYAEGSEGRPSSVGRAIRGALVVISLYAVVQTTVAVPPWDQKWLDTVQLTSVGGGDLGPLRAFGPLNAPGTLAGVLGLGLVWYLGDRRADLSSAVACVVILAGLALTSVRSAWVALAAAGIAHLVVTRGRSTQRVLGAVLGTIVVVGVLAGANPSAGSVVERVATFGTLSQDTSARARYQTPSELILPAATAPLGHGSGVTGEAARLAGGSSELRYPDNAYLSVLLQSGPIGFVLVIAALVSIVGTAWRLARHSRPRSSEAETCFAVIVYVLVLMIGGDHFYGAVSILFWLVVGYVLGLHRRSVDHPALGDPRASA